MPATKRSPSSFAMSVGFSTATTSEFSASATGRVWKRCATAAGTRFSTSGAMWKFFRLTKGTPSFLAISAFTTSASTTPMSARIWPSGTLRSRASMASASWSSVSVR